MDLIPHFETIPPCRLVGLSMRMSVASDRTAELWRSFMPRRSEVRNQMNQELISMEIFDDTFELHTFTPQTEFEKWAAVRVTDFSGVPDGMRTHTLSGGLYVAFKHIGPADKAAQALQYIFTEWLPRSDYERDRREHFEVMAPNYRSDAVDAEETLWIPIRRKPHR